MVFKDVVDRWQQRDPSIRAAAVSLLIDGHKGTDALLRQLELHAQFPDVQALVVRQTSLRDALVDAVELLFALAQTVPSTFEEQARAAGFVHIDPADAGRIDCIVPKTCSCDDDEAVTRISDALEAHATGATGATLTAKLVAALDEIEQLKTQRSENLAAAQRTALTWESMYYETHDQLTRERDQAYAELQKLRARNTESTQ